MLQQQMAASTCCQPHALPISARKRELRLPSSRRDVWYGTAAALSLAQLQQLSAQAATLLPRLVPGPLLDLQTDYDRYSSSYDVLDGGAASSALGFQQLRAQLLQQAQGDVLEVAVGTGLNLPFYSWPSITTYTGVDLSPGMLSAARARAEQLAAAGMLPAALVSRASSSGAGTASRLPLQSFDQQQQQQQQQPRLRPAVAGTNFQLQQGNATALPYPDASFDTVTDTFSLCVIDRPLAALQEMRRVLRPQGRILLLEHSRSDNPLLGAYQDLTEPLVTPTSKGCVWNQDLPQLLAAAGLQAVSFSRHLSGTISSIVAVRAA